MKFNKSKCTVLQLSHSNSRYKYRLRDELIENSPVKKDSWLLVNEKLDMASNVHLQPRRQSTCWVVSEEGDQQVERGDSVPLLW